MFWWILTDSAVLLLALPGLAWALWTLVTPLRAISAVLEEIGRDCNAIAPALDKIPDLAETELFTGAGLAGITRYADALRGLR